MAKEDKIVFCTGGGCTAKLGAGVQLVRKLKLRLLISMKLRRR